MKYLVLLLILLLPLASAIVYAQPEVNVKPEKGHAGSIVLVYGSGFTPYSNITIYFDAEKIAETPADGYGSFYTYIQIPLDATPGQHIIRAEDLFGIERSTEFLVTQPRISLSPSSGAIDTRVSISVEGLTPYEAYIVKFDDITLHPYLLSDEEGRISTEAAIPAATKGDHYIRIIYAPAFWGFLVEPLEVVKARFEITNGVATIKDINELRDLISELDSKIDDVNSTLYELILDVESGLESDIDSVNESLSNYIGQLETLVNDLMSDVEVLNTRLNNFINEARGNHTLLANELDGLRNELASLGTRLDKAVGSINELIAVLDNRINELNTSLADNVDNLLSKLMELKSRLENARNTLTTRINELEKSLGDTRAELETKIQDTSDRLSNSISSLEQQLQQRINELEQKLRETSEELAVAKQQNMILAAIALATAIAATALGAYAIKKR